MKIKLGNTVRDNLTGFTGIVTSRTEYLYGCVHCGVTPSALDKDGKVQQAEFFDEQRLEIVAASKAKKSKDSTAKTGGPAILGRPSARTH